MQFFSQQVNQDAFLFSIRQALLGRTQQDGTFQSHLRYEPYLLGNWSLPAKPDFTSFKQSLIEIVEYQYHVLPNYKRKEILSLDNVAWFAQSVATLFSDMDFLTKQYTGFPLPQLKTSCFPKINSHKDLAQHILSHFQEKGEGETQPKLHFNYEAELWSLVFFVLRKTFGDYATLFVSYAEWSYLTTAPEEETPIDWNQRPPCGIAYRIQFKELFEEERRDRKAGTNSKNGGKGHSERPEKTPYNNGVTPQEAPKHAHKKEQTKRPTRQDFFAQNEAIAAEEREQEEIRVQTMIAETKKAIAHFEKNTHLGELLLSPQNSFLRRQQHMLVTEAGIETESRGEGKERCVCLVRRQLN